MAGGATAAFKQTPLYNWLQENNHSEELMKNAVDNFAVSLAGYSVAKYGTSLLIILMDCFICS